MTGLDFLCRSKEFNRRLEEARGRLYRMAYAWSHNAALAEDLAQEALAKALKHTAQLRDISALDAWLFRILANCWNDHFRRSRDMEDIEEVALSDDVTPEVIHGQRQIVNRVRAAIAELPDGQRQVLTLVDLEGFAYNEVADILSVPIGTVMSRLCRARRTLKSLLLAQGTHSEEAAERPQLRRVK
jgi:RNA polymerase sigma-70 factor (ECF subfamily)